MFSIIALISFIHGYPTITWVSAVTEMVLWYYMYTKIKSEQKYYILDNVRYIVKDRRDMYDV